MKEKRILNAIGQVNEEYIVEAAPARKARKQPKWIKWGAVAACLCFVLAGVLFSSTPTTPGFSLVMTAYAADGTGYEIGTTPVVITDDMSINSGFYARYDEGNGHGRENFLFRIVCENSDIESVSYTINGEENAQSLSDLENNNAWFATQELLEDASVGEFPVYATRRSADGIYSYSYVGNTYTVNNDDQRSSEVFLEYRIADDNGQWSADEINITVSLKLKDGTTLEKELFVCPTYDSTTRNVEISVKDAEKWNG